MQSAIFRQNDMKSHSKIPKGVDKNQWHRTPTRSLSKEHLTEDKKQLENNYKSKNGKGHHCSLDFDKTYTDTPFLTLICVINMFVIKITEMIFHRHRKLSHYYGNIVVLSSPLCMQKVLRWLLWTMRMDCNCNNLNSPSETF